MRTHRIDLENAFEANWMDSILAEEGIPHTIVSHESSAYDGLFQMTRGWGFLEVPEEFRDAVEKLLQDFKHSLNESQNAGLSGANGVMMDAGPLPGCHEAGLGQHGTGRTDCLDAGSPAANGRARQNGASGIEEVNAMFDHDQIQSVMNQTGADRDTASAALKTSDGNVEIAVRIIRSYTLRDEAVPGGETAGRGTAGGWAGAAGSAGTGYTGTGSAETGYAGTGSAGSGQESQAGQGAYGTAGTQDAGEPEGQAPGQSAGQTEGKRGNYNIPKAQEIIDAIKDIWNKGNASRLDIEKDGRVILSLPLTVGTIGLALAPVAALIGLGAALVTQFTIKITLDNGTVINVNEFAVTHKHTSETRGPKDPGEPE